MTIDFLRNSISNLDLGDADQNHQRKFPGDPGSTLKNEHTERISLVGHEAGAPNACSGASASSAAAQRAGEEAAAAVDEAQCAAVGVAARAVALKVHVLGEEQGAQQQRLLMRRDLRGGRQLQRVHVRVGDCLSEITGEIGGLSLHDAPERALDQVATDGGGRRDRKLG